METWVQNMDSDFSLSDLYYRRMFCYLLVYIWRRRCRATSDGWREKVRDGVFSPNQPISAGALQRPGIVLSAPVISRQRSAALFIDDLAPLSPATWRTTYRRQWILTARCTLLPRTTLSVYSDRPTYATAVYFNRAPFWNYWSYSGTGTPKLSSLSSSLNRSFQNLNQTPLSKVISILIL